MGSIPLDVHAHLAPILPERLATLPGARWLPEAPALELDGHRVGMADLFHPDRLLAWMASNRVQRARVSIPPPLYRQHLDADAALQWARYVNEGLLQACDAHPGRLRALLHLPLEHPDACTRLLDEYAGRGAVGVALAAGGAQQKVLYSDPVLDALWARLDALQAFVFLHPGACADGRLAPFYLENLVGNPVETGVAAAHLVMAGVPARHPRIRFCLAHAGGVFACLCGRLARGVLTRRPGVPTEVEPPLAAARRMSADGIAHHGATLALAREVFGEERVFFGSDWPFPMGVPQPSPEDTWPDDEDRAL